jgi:NADP-dependent 3-hydroxy acid dehydrogenase YdfG
MPARTFATEDQRAFAEWSGDYNPIHLDPIAARRTLAGKCIVHGMHLVLWALDAWLHEANGLPPGRRLARLTARFHAPVLVGEQVGFRIASASPDGFDLSLIDADGVCAKISCVLERGTALVGVVAADAPAACLPANPEFAMVGGMSGAVCLYAPPASRAAFRAANEQLGAMTTAALMAASRVVGMCCPGENSLLSEVVLTFEAGQTGGELLWHVVQTDPRFSLVTIAVQSQGLNGQIRSFYRSPPNRLPSLSQLSGKIRADVFADQTALIVGGGRGLGEMTAKIVALGGGRVILTYRTGLVDAERVLQDIRGYGGAADAFRFDVQDGTDLTQTLQRIGSIPTHLYYFATPRIFGKRRRDFQPPLFDRFIEVYVKGFVETVMQTIAAGCQHLTCFYPSTVAIDEPTEELSEYVAAKAAGEEICRHLTLFRKDVEVFVSRLPRTQTDQTSTLIKWPAASPFDVMLPIVERMSGIASSRSGLRDAGTPLTLRKPHDAASA